MLTHTLSALWVFTVSVLTRSKSLACRRWSISADLILWMMLRMSSLCACTAGRPQSSAALWCDCGCKKKKTNGRCQVNKKITRDNISGTNWWLLVHRSLPPAAHPASRSAVSGGWERLGCRESADWCSAYHTFERSKRSKRSRKKRNLKSRTV